METGDVSLREERQAHPLSSNHQHPQREHASAGLVRVRAARQQPRERSLQIPQEWISEVKRVRKSAHVIKDDLRWQKQVFKCDWMFCYESMFLQIVYLAQKILL